MIQVAKHGEPRRLVLRDGVKSEIRTERLRRILSVLFVGFLCLGFTGAAGHIHDGTVNPTSCAVCHVGGEAASGAPDASAVIAMAPVVDLPSIPTSEQVVLQLHPTSTLGPRAPPA